MNSKKIWCNILILFLCYTLSAQEKDTLKEIGSFSWNELDFQKSEKNICQDTNKTMVFVYSDLANFILIDNETMILPVSSPLYAKEIYKHIFCLRKTNETLKKNGDIEEFVDVPSFVISKNNNNILEIKKIVEETEREIQRNLELRKMEGGIIRKDSILSLSPEGKGFNSIVLFWQKLNPQKIQKGEYKNTEDRMIFVYSDISNFIMEDGDHLITPATTVSFVEDIKKNIFYLKHPNPDFIISSSQISDSLYEIPSFVVGKDVTRLSEMSKLVEQELNALSTEQRTTTQNIDKHPVEITLLSQKLNITKAEKNVCDTTHKMLVIYSEIQNFNIKTPANVIYPNATISFTEKIKKNIFCIDDDAKYFLKTPFSIDLGENKDILSFVVDKDSAKLKEMAKRIENTQDSIFETKEKEEADSNSVEISLYLKEINPHKIEKYFCDTSSKSIIIVYSKFQNFTINDGNKKVSPIFTNPVINEIQKYIFCIESSNLNFKSSRIGENDLRVATFVAGKDETEISTIENLVEMVELSLKEEQGKNISQKKNEQTKEEPVSISLSWKKLTPQKAPDTVCDKTKSQVFIYSKISNFTMQDGDKVVSPTLTVPFFKDIKKKIFCLNFSSSDFIENLSLNNQEEIGIASFVVDKDAKNLDTLAKLVEEEYQKLLKKEIPAQNIEKKSNTIGIEKKENAKDEKKIELQKQNEPINLSSEKTEQKQSVPDDYGYRIQIFEKQGESINKKDLQKFLQLPYTLKRDKKENVEYILVGFFDSLDEAKNEATEIKKTYKIKDVKVILYKKNKRICSFN